MVDSRIAVFEDIHTKIMEMFHADMKSGKSYADKNLADAFLNIYKIHLEMADGTLSLLKDRLVSHVASGVLLRTMFENYATFSYLCGDTRRASRYVKKISYFDDKNFEEIREKLESDNGFANISRFGGKNTTERIGLLGGNILMTYKMLSAYTHAAPFITKQLQGGDEKRFMGKYGHLSMLCVLTESLVTLAMNHRIFDDRYAPFNVKVNELIDFPD